MKKKKSFGMTIVCSMFSFLVGVLLLAFPNISTSIDNATTLLYTIMFIYASIKFIEYVATKEQGDYENLFVAMVSVIAGTSGIIFNLESSAMVLSLTLISWVAMMAIIKLIKIDYLMDHKNEMWNVKIITFAAFLLIGILTSINLYYGITIQTLMLGFFFLVNGLLEIAYPLIEIFYHKFKIEEKEDVKPPKVLKEKAPEVLAKIKKPTIKKASAKKTATKKELKTESKKAATKKVAIKKSTVKKTAIKKKSAVKKK